MARAAGALLGSYEVVAVVGAGRISARKIPLVVIPIPPCGRGIPLRFKRRKRVILRHAARLGSPRTFSVNGVTNYCFSADSWSAAIHLDWIFHASAQHCSRFYTNQPAFTILPSYAHANP